MISSPRDRDGMTRRGIGVVAAVLAVLPAFAAASAPGDGPRPRNIVLVVVDDQRYDELGFLDPVIDTPNMDRLAEGGVHFANAFVTTSLCSPSRASILTGLYASAHGIVDNREQDMKPGIRFFPEYLQEAGYETAFVGKWHMGRRSAEPRRGFDHWVSFAGQGSYLPVNERGEQQWINVDGERVPQRGYITDELTDYAIDWLDHRESEAPFLLYLSHKAVHSDFVPAERHAGLYGDVTIEPPESQSATSDDLVGKPMWVRNYRNSYHGVEFPYYSDLDVQAYKMQYHRTLAAVDESLGRILGWLADHGIDDQTIVLYMGDNGFLFGEHGMIDKRNAYEESMRIPLLASAPGLFPAGTVVDEMVANIDVAPTILDLAGVPVPDHMQGRCFRRLAEGRAVDDWRSELLYQYYWEWVYPQAPTTFALRTDSFKLIQYHGLWDIDELYDMRRDPRERVNLIDRPENRERVVAMRRRLHRLVVESGGAASVPFTMKINHGAMFRNRLGGGAAEFPDSMLRTSESGDLLDFEDQIRSERAKRTAGGAGDRPPNVVVVFVDDLGYGDLGVFGHPTIRTPHIDRLAMEGQKWTSFYAASSVCTPSRGGLLTGRYPVRLGLESDPDEPRRRVFFPDSTGGLSPDETTIPELLRKRGYATALIGKWHLGHLPQFLPMRQGFDTYWGIPYSNDENVVGGWSRDKFFLPPDINLWQVPILSGEREVERPADQRTITKRYTERAVDFIRRNRERPFFLLLSHTMPHVPVFASPEFLGRSAAGLYGDAVEELDWSTGRIVATLEDLGLERRTLVVFTSDNGPWLVMRELGGSAGPLRDGKGTTWEGGMRVPAVFWWPGTIAPAVVAGIGSTLDLLPTISSLADVELPADRVIDGVDLSATLKTGAASPRETLFYYREGKIFAVRHGRFKAHLITETANVPNTGRTRHERPLLYDLDRDPGERFDVADRHPEVVARILDVMAAHQATVKQVANQLILHAEEEH